MNPNQRARIKRKIYFRSGQELSLCRGLWTSSDEGTLLLAIGIRLEQCAFAQTSRS